MIIFFSEKTALADQKFYVNHKFEIRFLNIYSGFCAIGQNKSKTEDLVVCFVSLRCFYALLWPPARKSEQILKNELQIRDLRKTSSQI